MTHKIQNWSAWLSNGSSLTEGAVHIENDSEFELIKAHLDSHIPFRADDALEVTIIPEQQPDHILAIYLFKDWWTRPAFCKSWSDIPERTYWILTKTGTEYTAYMALPGNTYRAGFTANEGSLKILISAFMETTAIDEISMICVSDTNPYRCMEKLMSKAAAIAGIPTRDGRVYPAMFEKLGWCSWDAFYQDITEEKVLAKMQEIQEKEIPFGWILLDDGWHDVENGRLRKFTADPVKFPHGLAPVAAKIREMTKAQHVGIWHAFAGYWEGIAEDGDVYAAEQENLMPITDNRWAPIPDADKACTFFSDWYTDLAAQGIDFVKVDNQSSMMNQYRSVAPIGSSNAKLHQGLDRAVANHMHDRLINCMGMGPEDVLGRPTSALSRNSDDFFPLMENGFEDHFIQNAYNVLYHSVIYHCDWDMFWSNHPAAEKHAVIRALSGGPIYVSDKIGETNKEVLMHLCYSDGTLLRAPQSSLPTEDCLFQDPLTSGYLKITNECNGVAYLAVFNYTDAEIQVPYQVPGTGLRAIYGRNAGQGEIADGGAERICTLPPRGYELFMSAPVQKGIAVFGPIEKYLASHAITNVTREEDSLNIQIREDLPTLLYTAEPVTVSVNGKPAVTAQGFTTI